MTPRRWFRFSLRTMLAVVTVLALLAGWTAYQRQPGYPVEFVVSPGYTGVIEIVKDSKEGLELKLDQGKYVFDVPPSGVIRIKKCDSSTAGIRKLAEIQAARSEK